MALLSRYKWRLKIEHHLATNCSWILEGGCIFSLINSAPAGTKFLHESFKVEQGAQWSKLILLVYLGSGTKRSITFSCIFMPRPTKAADWNLDRFIYVILLHRPSFCASRTFSFNQLDFYPSTQIGFIGVVKFVLRLWWNTERKRRQSIS